VRDRSKWEVRFRRFSWIFLVPMAACGGSSTEGQAAAGGPVEVTADNVHVLGTSDALAVVLDLEVLPDGRVWVLNSAAPFFVGFDADGGLIDTWGEEGGGPEEFRLPAGFVTGGLDGEAWVLDLRRHTLIRVSRPEAPWAEVRIPRDVLPPGTVQGGLDLMTPVVRTGSLGGRVILPYSTGSLQTGIFSMIEGMLKADLMSLDPSTGDVGRVLGLGEAIADPFVGFEPTEGGFPLWKRLWAVCGEDEIRVYDRVRNELRGFDSAGTELAPLALPATGLDEVTPQEFAGAVFPLRQAEITGGVGNRLSTADSIRLINTMAQDAKGDPAQLAAYLPAVVDFRCSTGGTMWIRPLDLSAGGLSGGRVWIQVGPDGVTRPVTLPERFDPIRFTEDRVWGVLRDELDVAAIAWAELPA